MAKRKVPRIPKVIDFTDEPRGTAYNHLIDFAQRPKNYGDKEFEALKFRWRFKDGKLHKLAESAKKHGVNMNALLSAPTDFVKRPGGECLLNQDATKEMVDHLITEISELPPHP
jgi:hypothetical protein